MAIGLGQMLIGGLLGHQIGKGKGLMDLLGTGGDKGKVTEDQMNAYKQNIPTQVASTNQQQGGGIMSGIENMFGNPSQEKIARMGLAFNSMRMHPDSNLAASFQKTIDSSKTNSSRQALITVLEKQGKKNVAQLLRIGAITVAEASKESLKKGTGTDIEMVLKYLRKPHADPAVQAKLADLAEIVEADNSMSDEAFAAAMELTGLTADANKQYALGLSEIFTHQGKEAVDENGRSREGQHYQMQTDKASGETEKVWLDSFGETLLQKQERIAKQEDLVRDKAKAQSMGNEYYAEAREYRMQVDQFEQIIATIEDGALSGQIASRLPAMDAATARLRGLVNELGISVINSATFGALSEREMQMAMRTNINEGLKPEELRKMVIEQIKARRKLAQEYEKMAKRAKFEGDGTWSSFVKLSMEETARHDAVVWEELNASEIESLALRGVDRQDYMDWTYEQRRALFDGRD
jgi:hypothetical protein